MNSTQIDPCTIDPDDHDAIHNYIAGIPEDELKKMQGILAYFFPIWAGNRVKKSIVDKLVDEDKKFLFQSLLLVSYAKVKSGFHVQDNEGIGDDSDTQSQDIGRKAVEDIITGIRDGNDQKIEELICEFKNRVAAVRIFLIKKVEDYKFKHLPREKKEQIENLRKLKDKEETINTIIASHYRDDERVKILDESVKNFDSIVNTVDLHVFTSKALQLNKSHIAILTDFVSDPGCLIPQNAVNILKGVDAPNSWYTHRSLTIPEYRKFCENLADPKEWSYIIGRTCKNILQKLHVPIASIQARKRVITEIIESLYDGRFEVGMLSMYAEIEGLLWDFAFEINRKEVIFEKNDNTRKTLIDAGSGEPFKSDRIRDVIERTAMKNHVDAKFIIDFCEGIYEERNPILHGRQNCFATCSNNVPCVAQKLMTIEYVLDLLIEEFQKNLFEQWDNMPPDVIERTVDAYERWVNG